MARRKSSGAPAEDLIAEAAEIKACTQALDDEARERDLRRPHGRSPRLRRLRHNARLRRAPLEGAQEEQRQQWRQRQRTRRRRAIALLDVLAFSMDFGF